MQQKLRWGFLSTAKINDALVGPLRRAVRSELLAVASRDLQRARSYAAQRKIPRAYGSYEQLLADPDVDVIYVSLPNSMHAEWTVKALEAGKHVLCEKPMAVAAEELDRIEAAARGSGRIVFEAFMYLHHPQMQRLRRILEAGDIGALQLVSAAFSFHLPAEDAANIRLRGELAGGALWDVGVYPVSLSVFLNGGRPPETVWAHTTLGETGIDVSARGLLRLGPGASACVFAGFRAPPLRAALVVGDRGSVQVAEPWKPSIDGPAQLAVTDAAGRVRSLGIPRIDPYLCEVQAMEACALDGAEPLVPLGLSRAVTMTVLALYRSAATGKPETP